MIDCSSFFSIARRQLPYASGPVETHQPAYPLSLHISAFNNLFRNGKGRWDVVEWCEEAGCRPFIEEVVTEGEFCDTIRAYRLTFVSAGAMMAFKLRWL